MSRPIWHRESRHPHPPVLSAAGSSGPRLRRRRRGPGHRTSARAAFHLHERHRERSESPHARRSIRAKPTLPSTRATAAGHCSMRRGTLSASTLGRFEPTRKGWGSPFPACRSSSTFWNSPNYIAPAKSRFPPTTRLAELKQSPSPPQLFEAAAELAELPIQRNEEVEADGWWWNVLTEVCNALLEMSRAVDSCLPPLEEYFSTPQKRGWFR